MNQSGVVLISRNNEVTNCGFVKTILMLLVVFYHSILYWNGQWFIGKPEFASPLFSIIAQWLNTFHIYTFTLVSGYLFYYLKFEKGKYGDFLSLVRNKSKRLLIPYISISIVWAIPFAMFFYQYSLKDLFMKFVIGISPAQLWFLLMLFNVFIIFYPLSNFFKEHNIYGICIVFFFYISGIVGMALFMNILQAFSALTYIPYFWLGFKLRQYGMEYVKKIPCCVWFFIDVALFIFIRSLSKYNGVFFSALTIGFTVLLNAIGSIMAFVILQKLAERVNCNNKTFIILSKNSMPVYLFHQQIVYVFIYYLNGAINPYLHAVITFIGAIIISLLVSMFMMKFKWTKILIGVK